VSKNWHKRHRGRGRFPPLDVRQRLDIHIRPSALELIRRGWKVLETLDLKFNEAGYGTKRSAEEVDEFANKRIRLTAAGEADRKRKVAEEFRRRNEKAAEERAKKDVKKAEMERSQRIAPDPLMRTEASQDKLEEPQVKTEEVDVDVKIDDTDFAARSRAMQRAVDDAAASQARLQEEQTRYDAFLRDQISKATSTGVSEEPTASTVFIKKEESDK
jgi:hypothetical protein